MICKVVRFCKVFVRQKILQRFLYTAGSARRFLVCKLFFLFYLNEKSGDIGKRAIEEIFREVSTGAKNTLQPKNRPQSHISIEFIGKFKNITKPYKYYKSIGSPRRAIYLLSFFVRKRI